MGGAGNGEEDRRMDGEGTGDTVMGGGGERGALGNPPPRDSRDPECNYEANPRYCTFANSWSTPCREHSTCIYFCTVLLLRLVHET